MTRGQYETPQEPSLIYTLKLSFTFICECFTDGKAILVQLMAWCYQATSHYLEQFQLNSMTYPWLITRLVTTLLMHWSHHSLVLGHYVVFFFLYWTWSLQSHFMHLVYNWVHAFFIDEWIVFPKSGHLKCSSIMKKVTASLTTESISCDAGLCMITEWLQSLNDYGPTIDNPLVWCSIGQQIPVAQIPRHLILPFKSKQ